MWMLLAMCCCLPLCAYMYMRSRRNAQMQGDGFNRVGGFGGGGFGGGGYGGGYNGYDDDFGRPPPGTRYVVVQRGPGQGFGNGGAGVPIGGQPNHFGGGQQMHWGNQHGQGMHPNDNRGGAHPNNPMVPRYNRNNNQNNQW